MSENERITREFMRGYQDGTTIAKGVAESLLAQANSEKAALMRRIDELCEENEKLRKLAKDLHTLAYNVLPQRKSDYMTICSVEWCIDYYSKTMPAIEDCMRKLGIEVPE